MLFLLSYIYFYNHFWTEIDRYNNEFIEKELIRTKSYFDNLLSYKLDIQQRKAVLTDDFYFITEVEKVYRSTVSDADTSLLNSYNFKRMGFVFHKMYWSLVR